MSMRSDNKAVTSELATAPPSISSILIKSSTPINFHPSQKMSSSSSRQEKNEIIDEKFCFEEETHLTVHKTSIFVPGGDGFVVYDPAGEILFRVDSYGPGYDSRDEVVLMDSTGKPLVTLHRKKPSLHQRWEGYLGEKQENQEPLFSIFKTSIVGQFEVVAELHDDRNEDYHIEGPRSCTVYRTRSNIKQLVAEIKRKVDPNTNIVLGKDVFLLCLQPMIDSAFVMSLVLIVDHIGGFDVVDDDSSVL